MIFVNFKTYPQATGANALKIAQAIKSVSEETGVDIIACPQLVDIYEVSKILPGKTWTQHVDFVARGQATGWLPVEVAKESGAAGTFLSHSEHKLPFDVIARTVEQCKITGLKTLLFTDSVEVGKQLSSLSPDYISYEPGELIASKETSVAKAKADVITSIVNLIPNVPIIVGAGVKDQNDVRVSVELGAKGVALASSVILAEDPKVVLKDLARGFSASS